MTVDLIQGFLLGQVCHLGNESLNSLAKSRRQLLTGDIWWRRIGNGFNGSHWAPGRSLFARLRTEF